MRIRKSEYQNQYKACIVKKNQAAYLENLNLRHQRRDREFLHTPICWEELSEEEKVSSDCSDEGPPKSAKPQQSREPETQYQSLAEIMSDSRGKAEAIRKQKHEGFITSNDASTQKRQFEVPAKVPEEEEERAIETENQKSEQKSLAHKSKSINNFVDDENRKLNKKLALTYAIKPKEDHADFSEDTDHDIKSAGKFLAETSEQSAVNKRTKTCRKKKSKEPEGLNKIKSTTQTSSNSTRIQNTASSKRYYLNPQAAGGTVPETFVPPLSIPRVRRPDRQTHIPRTKSTPGSPEPPLKEKPPFIAYGIGDKEDNLATHRTHNVRASVDVYPHALRAKIRREEQHKRQKEKIRRARSAEAVSDKLSAAFTQDHRDWESEYRKQFHGYEPKDYERAIASHAVIPRSSQVRAVHRGGCLLVHVD